MVLLPIEKVAVFGSQEPGYLQSHSLNRPVAALCFSKINSLQTSSMDELPLLLSEPFFMMDIPSLVIIWSREFINSFVAFPPPGFGLSCLFLLYMAPVVFYVG